MGVFRVHKNDNYTVLSNYHFKEKGMSLKAKGLLSLMLSLPETWDYSAAGLVTLSKDGKDSVNAALKELEQFGYLKRTQAFAANGTFGGYDYEIFEKPNTGSKKEKPTTGKPKAEKPFTEKPSTGNPQQLNTNELNKKELNNNLLNKEEEERKKDKPRSGYDFIIDGRIFEEDVKKELYEFIKMRKLMKQPLTDYALEKLIDKLYKFSYDPKVQIEILENSIVNNYKDIYKPKQQKQQAAKNNVTPINSAKDIDSDIDEDDVLKCFNGVLFLSENQVKELIDIMGLQVFDIYTDKLTNYIKNNGNVINHYATMKKWYLEDTRTAL